MKNLISDSRRIFEIVGVTITALGKFVFMDYLKLKLPFILIAIAFWAIYILYRGKTAKGIFKYWGFRVDNFKETTKIVAPFGLVAAVAFLIVGAFQNTLNFTWHLIPILILYPIWGCIQQFLVIGLVAGNLHDIESVKIKKGIIIIITALLFGGLHTPFLWLVFGTFTLAIFYGFIYLKVRNIFVLGLFHGWLGGLFFYTVVDRDPFLEIFGSFLEQ